MSKKLAILASLVLLGAAALLLWWHWTRPILDDSVGDAVVPAADHGAFAELVPYRQFVLPSADAPAIEAWETVEFCFPLEAGGPTDPFDPDLVLELDSPTGDRLAVPAFAYGYHAAFPERQAGMVRFYVKTTGRWSYSLRTADALFSGAIVVNEPRGSGNGPLIRERGERWFKDERNGTYPYLQAKFLDFEGHSAKGGNRGTKGFDNTHVYLSEDVPDSVRVAIIRRQLELGNRRINIYLSNYGDYQKQRIVPWQVASGTPDYSRFDLRKMKLWDRRIKALLDAGIYVQFWFLADDSKRLLQIPDPLSEPQFRRFVKYAVARWSGCQNILWCLSLECEENNPDVDVWNRVGRFLAQTDPYGHPRSVHSVTRFDFPKADWATFQIFQLGFHQGHRRIHERTLAWMDGSNRPAFAEEFSQGVENLAARRETWAALCAGATAGTGAFLKPLNAVMAQVDLRGLRCRDALAQSEKPAYVLANPNSEYIVYLPEKHRFRLDLRGATKPLVYRWIDPATGDVIASGDVPANGEAVEFDPPPGASEDVVLYCSCAH